MDKTTALILQITEVLELIVEQLAIIDKTDYGISDVNIDQLLIESKIRDIKRAALDGQ